MPSASVYHPEYIENEPHAHSGVARDFRFLPQIWGYSYRPTTHRPKNYHPPNLNDARMSWQRRFTREPVDPETLEPEKLDYTNRELEDYADAILRKDAKENNPIHGENPILFEEHLYNRRRREILVTSGTPDDIQGLDDERGVHRGDGQKIFNRTHPQGRKVNSEHQRRKNGASYYRHHLEYDKLFSFGEPTVHIDGFNGTYT